MDRRRILAFSVLALLLAAGTAAAYLVLARPDVTTSSKEALRLYQRGLENEQKMYAREALEDYAAALGKDPYFLMATLRLASALYARDPERAKGLVECAARHREDVTPRERLYLDIQLARHRHDRKAVEALVGVYVKRFPSDPEAYLLEARLKAGAGDPAEVAKVYEKLLTIDPNYAVAYNFLGYNAMAMREWAKAEDYFKRYRFLAPDQANPFDSLGELYAATGRYAEARQSLQQALAVKPDFGASVGHLGTVAVGEGNYLEAAQRYREAAAFFDSPLERVDLLVAAVMSLVRAERPEEAEKLLLEVEAASHAMPEKQQDFVKTRAQLFRVVMAAQRGDFAEADRVLAEVSAAHPPSGKEPKADKVEEGAVDWESSLAVLRATVARMRGDHTLAAQEFASGLKERQKPKGGSFPYFPYTDVFRADAAESLAAAGRRDDARKLLALTLERNPRFQPAMQAAARLGLPSPGPAAATAQR